MIVVDEAISYPRIIEAIARWYKGTVISVRQLRPHARLLDPEIPQYLMQIRQPTFVTINYTDWNKPHLAHSSYSIVSLKLTSEESLSVPLVLREILNLPDYRTKQQRMGKVICWTKQDLFHYEK